MAPSTILVSTWSDGVFVLDGAARAQELAGQSVNALAADGRGGAIAIVEGHALRRRAADGAWSTLVTTDANLACCVAVGDLVFLGTDDARVLRLGANGELAPLPGFQDVAGRETWYAGQALVDGRMMGPPLGVRSITATADGRVLLANVHVGGIPRSTDGGLTWQPTIAVESDVHEVRAHPTRPELVVAAAAVGLCVSHDGGATWTIASDGLHATHGTAVGFANEEVLLGASADQFSPEGGLYRRPVGATGPLVRVGEWLDGIADTRCIGTNGAMVAVADGGGSVHVSDDGGHRWTRWTASLPAPSSVVVMP